MSRKLVMQISAACLGIVLFGGLLTFARTRFSGKQATNLLGVLQDQPQDAANGASDAQKQRSVTEYAMPMYCCPDPHGGKSCRLVDSIERQSCGQEVNGEFDAGDEFQPTEAGFEACEADCQAL